MICSNCGSAIADGAEKCPECGTLINKNDAEKADASSAKYNAPLEKKPLYKATGIEPARPVRKIDDNRPEKVRRAPAPFVKIVIWAVVIIVLAALIIFAVGYFNKINHSDDVPNIADDIISETDADPGQNGADTAKNAEDTKQNDKTPVEQKPEYDIRGTWRWESESDGYRDTYWVFSNNGNLEIYLVGFSYDYEWPENYEYDKHSYVLSLTKEAMGLAWLDENTFACGAGKAYREEFADIPEDAVNVKTFESSVPDDTEEDDEYLLPTSSSAYLTADDLADIDPEMLRVARNEIFARHGRLFSDEDLQKYFNEQSWYNGYIKPANFNSSVLNDYERYNAAFIGKYEESLTH